MKNSFFVLQLKIMLKNKLTCILLIITATLFLITINYMAMHADERSSLPIGLVNEDQSDSASELVKRLQQVPALYVIEADEEQLKELLKEEQINAYFIITNGYERAIQSGKIDQLIEMYYLKDNNISKILSDIIAGEMLYRISLYKGYHLYESIPFDKLLENRNSSKGDTVIYSKQEYYDYANSLIGTSDFNFAFDFHMVDGKKANVTTNALNNSILYLQIIWGVIGLLLSFITMILTSVSVLEKENGLYNRLRISMLKSVSLDAIRIGSILSITAFIFLLFSFIFVNKYNYIDLGQGVMLFILMMLFSSVMIMCFTLIGKFVKTIIKYQFISVFLIFILGLLSFVYLLKGFIEHNLIDFIKFIPNSWFIMGFTDIISNNILQEIPLTSFVYFVLTASILLLLNMIIGIRQKR